MKKIILFLTVLGCFLSSNANAGRISGWGYKLGSIVAQFELRGAGNVKDGDTVNVDILVTEIEYVCGNPGANTFVVNGTPGLFNFIQNESVFNEDFVSKGGKTTVTITIDTIIIENNLECVNDNWTVLEGSAAPNAFDATAIWFNGDGTEIDRVEAICTLDPIERDPATNLPILDPPQIFNCV